MPTKKPKSGARAPLPQPVRVENVPLPVRESNIPLPVRVDNPLPLPVSVVSMTQPMIPFQVGKRYKFLGMYGAGGDLTVRATVGSWVYVVNDPSETIGIWINSTLCGSATEIVRRARKPPKRK